MSASGRALTDSERTSKGVRRPLRTMRIASRPRKTSTGQLSPIWKRLMRNVDIGLSLVRGSNDGGSHDAVDSDVVAGKLDVDTALQHDDDPVDDADEFARVGRVPEYGDALPRDFGDESVDVRLPCPCPTRPPRPRISPGV